MSRSPQGLPSRFADRPPAVAVLSALVLLLAVLPVRAARAAPTAPVDLSQLTLEELVEVRIESVSSASKYVQSTADAPTAMTVVEGSEIRAFGHRTLADILSTVEGCYVRYDRNYHYLGVRGFSRPGDFNNRVLLLVDGHRLNENIYQAAPIGTEFPIDIDLIDHVEIARGPGFAAFGNNALLAIVNVVTRTGPSIGGVELQGVGGSENTGGGRLTWGDRLGEAGEGLLSASYLRSDGQRHLYFREFDQPAEGRDGVARRMDGDSGYQLMGQARWRDFSLNSVFGHREKRVPAAAYGTTFGDPRFMTYDRWGFVEGHYLRPAGPGGELSARLAWDAYNYMGSYPYDEAFNRDRAKSSTLTGELQMTRISAGRYAAVGGLEYLTNFRQEQLNYDLDPKTLYFEDVRSQTNWALYAQGEVTISPPVTIGAGARFDHFESFGETFNPRVSLVLRPGERSTVKAVWGRAFRAPNLTELYYDDQTSSKGNPDLSPEKSSTIQLTWEEEILPRFHLSATAYQYTVDGLIDQIVDPADSLLIYVNSDRIRTRGLETALDGRVAGGLRGRISYSIQEAERVEGGGPLSNSPRHLAKGNLIVPMAAARSLIGIEIQYQSAVRSVADRRIPGFWLANASLSAPHLTRNLTASLTVYNLLDETYAQPAGPEFTQDRLTQDGRTARLSLTWKR